MSVVSDIIAYEEGELEADKVVKLFARLVETGMAWSLQGHYGRMAAGLIEDGFISPSGKVLRLPSDHFDD